MLLHCTIALSVHDSVFLAAPALDFGTNSFLEWDFTDSFYRSSVDQQRHLTDLQLMFRTRQASGLLLLAQNAHKSEYMKLEVRNKCV